MGVYFLVMLTRFSSLVGKLIKLACGLLVDLKVSPIKVIDIKETLGVHY